MCGSFVEELARVATSKREAQKSENQKSQRKSENQKSQLDSFRVPPRTMREAISYELWHKQRGLPVTILDSDLRTLCWGTPLLSAGAKEALTTKPPEMSGPVVRMDLSYSDYKNKGYILVRPDGESGVAICQSTFRDEWASSPTTAQHWAQTAPLTMREHVIGYNNGVYK